MVTEVRLILLVVKIKINLHVQVLFYLTMKIGVILECRDSLVNKQFNFDSQATMSSALASLLHSYEMTEISFNFHKISNNGHN